MREGVVVIVVFFVFIYFFFFKQKTAYEIYQCDWSSDVCSSDLGKGPFLIGGFNNPSLRYFSGLNRFKIHFHLSLFL